MELATFLKTRPHQVKTVLTFAATIMLLLIASCLRPNSGSMMNRGTGESVLGSADDKKAIERIYQNWYTAWKTKDYKLASQDYSGEAIWVNAFGMRRVGREEIEITLKRVFDMNNVMAGKSKTVEKTVKFINPEVALVTSRIERVGQQTRAGEDFTRKTTHLRVFVKSRGTWQIVSHLISDARSKERPEH